MSEVIETIKNYLKSNLDQGYQLEDLKRTLVQNGYTEEDVNIAASQLTSNTSAEPEPAVVPQPEPQAAVPEAVPSQSEGPQVQVEEAAVQPAAGEPKPSNDQMINYFQNKVKRTGFLIVAGGIVLLLAVIVGIYFFIIK